MPCVNLIISATAAAAAVVVAAPKCSDPLPQLLLCIFNASLAVQFRGLLTPDATHNRKRSTKHVDWIPHQLKNQETTKPQQKYDQRNAIKQQSEGNE